MKKNIFEPGCSKTIGLHMRRPESFRDTFFLYAAIITFFILTVSACKSKTSVAAIDSDTYYTCSMDPQVIASKPGKCPICHMDLTLVKKNTSTNKDEIALSEQQIQLGNIHTDTIRNGSIGDQLVLTGTLNFNQMKSSSVSARVAGRIEKMYF
jgi:Cu(I)/Ag(I) efflux system membrane fusion protein